MACVRKRKGHWTLDCRDALGRRRWKRFPSKRAADAALAEVVRQRQQVLRPAFDPDTQLEAYAERWLTLCAASLKPSTVKGYRSILRLHLLPALGTAKVRDLHRGRIKGLLAEKATSGLARDSVRLIHATLRALLNAAVDDGVLLANPADRLGRSLRLTASASDRQERIKALDREQLATFLTASLTTAPRVYPLFLTLARAGLRLGEALALQWADLDFTRREVRVERAIGNDRQIGTPKSGHGRTVDASLTLCGALRAHQTALRETGLARGAEMALWVFPSEAGTPLDHANVEKAFKRVLRVAGLPLHHSPHSLRHSFASLLLQQGESPAYVQRQLGHASIQLTVDTYGRWLPMGNKAAVDRLDEPAVLDGRQAVDSAVLG